jgi:hypothetical protein
MVLGKKSHVSLSLNLPLVNAIRITTKKRSDGVGIKSHRLHLYWRTTVAQVGPQGHKVQGHKVSL